MAPTRSSLALVALGLSALLGLTACGAGPPVNPPAGTAGIADLAFAGGLADEASALRAIGYETGLADAPAPSAPATAAAPADRPGMRRPAVRKFLRKNTLHGEMTVRGKDGVRTIVVQRGTVTAADGRTVSVKSADGFALTWTYGDQTRVVHDRGKAELSTVAVGAEIGVAGTRQGTVTAARLIAVS